MLLVAEMKSVQSFPLSQMHSEPGFVVGSQGSCSNIIAMAIDETNKQMYYSDSNWYAKIWLDS